MEAIPTSELSSDMPISFRMEALSLAYIRAIAAKAGALVSRTEGDFGVDISFSRIVKRKSRYTSTTGMPVHSQVKSSTQWVMRGDTIVYDLEAKNYNDLVNSSMCVLILMCLPPTFDE